MEVLELRARVEALSLTRVSFKDNDDKVNFYTGVSSADVLLALFRQIQTHINVTQGVSRFQQFVVTLMCLRLYSSCQDFATISRVFHNCIDVCNDILVPKLVIWCNREQHRLTLLPFFRKRLSKCVSIIDCLEISIERPSELKARAQLWSFMWFSKNHNTVKYLISIAPRGIVSFVSYGWGGRVSDEYVTENCGFLQNLSPGDVVLTERAFNIRNTLASFGTSLENPAFTKGQKRLEAIDTEMEQNTASVRTHVERVIHVMRTRFAIL